MTLDFGTVFNLLGPFANPGSVKRQVIGVPSKDIAEKLLAVAKTFTYEALTLVVSEDGMDEASTACVTYVYELKGGKIQRTTVEPGEFVPRAESKEFSGADANTNAEIITSILQGEKGPKRDVVILNAALALRVAGKARTIKQGIALAGVSIDNEQALAVLTMLRKEAHYVP